uniref:CARD domain-containing protein n=1 Tax=Maylandia zebra TaxID=106582 RepID=A0A3P9B6A3_9CICH
MAEKLGKMRTEFVSRVSKEILIQLLEALVAEGVFNDLEKESIMEKNRVTADKARCIIDAVKKKGDKASGIMIRHLQTRDPTLSSQLGLCSGPSAKHGEVDGIFSIINQ